MTLPPIFPPWFKQRTYICPCLMSPTILMYAKQRNGLSGLLCVLQPHSHTRTTDLFPRFFTKRKNKKLLLCCGYWEPEEGMYESKKEKRGNSQSTAWMCSSASSSLAGYWLAGHDNPACLLVNIVVDVNERGWAREKQKKEPWLVNWLVNWCELQISHLALTPEQGVWLKTLHVAVVCSAILCMRCFLFREGDGLCAYLFVCVHCFANLAG